MGAKLSLLDIITDIYMIYQFLTSKEEGQAIFGHINLAMVATSLLIQLVIVYTQNKKKGYKKLAYEVLTVILFIKPAVDALRVANGTETEEGSAFDPMAELMTTKGVEMVRDQGKGLRELSVVFPSFSNPSRPLTSALFPIKGRREHTCRSTPILCVPQI